MRFYTKKCKVKHLGLRNIMAKYTLCGAELGESELENDLDVLMNKRLNNTTQSGLMLLTKRAES